MNTPQHKLPHFLIIGGMKCGSTTVFRDLEDHPQVFLPLDKEPANLCHDKVLTPEGLAEYAAHFKPAKPDQKRGEASTDYTKRPQHEGVPQRALKVLGPELRIVYILRDPVARFISHHKHDGAQGLLPTNPDDALAREPGMIDFSRYAMQLEPWLDAFNKDNIMVVQFEHYTRDRTAHAERIQQHLGLEVITEHITHDRAFNSSAHKPVPNASWKAVLNSPIYRKTIRRFIPRDAKDRLRHLLLPKSTFTPEPPPRELLEQLVRIFNQDQQRLRQLLGDAAPSWDLESRWLSAEQPTA
mgnify:CR=1 FL=1